MSLKDEARLLRNTYFTVFFIGALFVFLMHVLGRPTLDILRIPTFIKASITFNGFDYWTTLRIYQLVLIFSLISIFLDGLCLTNLRSKPLIRFSKWTSIFGAIVMLLAVVFFAYNFFIVDESLKLTPLIYLTGSLFLVVLDLVTFRVDDILGGKKNV